MENFVEYRDYQFFALEDFLSQTKASVRRAYIVLKDNDVDKFENDEKLPSTYYIIVNSIEPSYIKKCIAFAVSKHLSNVKTYSSSVQIPD